MATKAKRTRKSSKKRLALPTNWVKNIDDARKNLDEIRGKGIKEAEKIYNKVIEIDFVKKARKHKVVKQATKAGKQATKDLVKELEQRTKKLKKEVTTIKKDIRKLVNIPTRSEVDGLKKKVDQLTKKVDELSKRKSADSAN